MTTFFRTLIRVGLAALLSVGSICGQSVTVTDPLSQLAFKPQVNAPAQPTAGFKLFSDATGNLKLINSSGTILLLMIPAVSGNSGRMLTTDGTSLVWSVQPTGTVPSVTGNAGKMMTTDGVSASWTNTISSLTTTSGRVTAIATVTGNATLDATNHHVVCNSASALQLTLPAAASHTGREYRVKNINTGTVSVVVTSAGTIDNAATYVLPQWHAAVFVSNGSIWLVN